MQQENAIRSADQQTWQDEQAHPSKQTRVSTSSLIPPASARKTRRAAFAHAPAKCTETALGCHVSLTWIKRMSAGVILDRNGFPRDVPLSPISVVERTCEEVRNVP